MAIHIRRQMGGVEGLRKISFHQQIGTNKTSDEGGGHQKREKIIFRHCEQPFTAIILFYVGKLSESIVLRPIMPRLF